ncbi:Enoyl-CoA hydratase/isomerase [Thermobaculum terrenum ATCC BAA-798]|uniref:Enoyl-CoA hydratase/isomerase n=1 Tax=Thermobaculum terrenum (strain ATCC BAA-798 / CCMEE 7001 / YNP1) TaxID=525904 RepID=D1CDC3_THET1|nr:enoyl-CoA hydratase/isomerase family protein [Thermobaculum terrenum]ACZ40929.1 Enoyl-CoA hydratase/isomerase [Thermobaculum terrenum ATCC BAA-798]
MEADTERFLQLQHMGNTLLITLNRPPVNAINLQVIEQLEEALTSYEEDKNTKAVIITGNGRCFSAGADIKSFLEQDPDSPEIPLIRKANDVLNFIESYPKVVIAAINGICLGGGNELALACDLRIASQNAIFGQPEIKLGLLPGWGGIQRLTRLLGKARALEMCLTGESLNADRALQIGLVNEVVSPEGLIDRSLEISQKLSSLPTLAVNLIKQRIHKGAGASQGQAIREDEWAFRELLSSSYGQEGIKAFLEKREPRWD